MKKMIILQAKLDKWANWVKEMDPESRGYQREEL